MKDAKSMYRGGDIVEARHCDFDSSRLLGLVCPFCNEAVYLRAGTSRIGKNKMVLVNPAFCHYPGSAEDLDCERRSISGEGREEIERIKAEKRGQRLELYNKHLWDMIASKNLVCILPGRIESDLVKLFGRQRFAAVLDGFKSVYPSCLTKPMFFEKVEKTLNLIFSIDTFDFDGSTKDDIRAINSLRIILQNSEKEWFQRAIVREVLTFFGSRTSGFAFRKVSTTAIFAAAASQNYSRQIEKYKQLILDAFIQDVSMTPWEAQIERFSNPDRKAADEKYFALLESASKTANKGI